MENRTEKILEDRSKINRVLRSLFRLKSFENDNHCPDIILCLEKNILKNALLELNGNQIKNLSILWPEYEISSHIHQVINDDDDRKSFKNYINNLN